MRHYFFWVGLALLTGCGTVEALPDGAAGTDADGGTAPAVVVERPPAPTNAGIYSFANGCYAMDMTAAGSSNTRWLQPSADGSAFEFSALSLDAATPFFLKASDLGHYLFYGQDRHYLTMRESGLGRENALNSDILLVDDSFVSPAEWELKVSTTDPERFALRHRETGRFLTPDGLTAFEERAGVIALYPREGCTAHPELTLDAEGETSRHEFDDGDLFGFADTHSHILSNFGFGGAGIFHGAPFHRLGVEHALPDCEQFHGADGRNDIFGFGFDQGNDFDTASLLTTFISGRTPGFNHHTAGYPEFTEWPAAPSSSTHQTQYYRWLERAWMGGLRLVVQHATSNSVICEMMVGNGVQPVRYSCNDMVAVNRIIEETYNMERYIDAQMGGPGQGFFRVVTSPAEAREVIREGKMAIILGIETSNLFDCFSTPRPGAPECDPEYISAQLDRYRDLGVRALFPVHKYDNAFSAGDGHRSIIELGNFVNSGHYSSFTQDCDGSIPARFDNGRVMFGGLNQPRDDYFATPPHDPTAFAENPIGALSPHYTALVEGSLEGDWCQSHGMTSRGEFLMMELMRRGMIIEVDHFPRRSYARAFELLEEYNYPAAGTHGGNFNGRIYALGGISMTSLGRCHDQDNPRSTVQGLLNRVARIAEFGGYPAEGFGFDLNGFAGSPGPRFGENSGCSQPQSNPITYPFESYDGAVTFQQPSVGNRVLDFNTEGMVHIGLLPELIEDARHDGATDEDLEPLFRSAEAYIRMWERAEERAAMIP